ncbi:MAG TPA: HupE/UreJ family protein [Burkholderiales bacterium]|nr:HupE/UreJ family protein [Burkholderiales bacterium]
MFEIVEKSPDTAGQVVRQVCTALVSWSPPLEKEGQGGFADVCSKQGVYKSLSTPLFQSGRPVHRRKSTVSEGAICLGLFCFVLALAWPASAFAHVGQGEAAGFLTGFVHPISGLDHVLAMVAVGLWSAQLGAPAIWVLPVAFPMVMAMGGMLGLMGMPVPGIEYGIAASAILLGAAVTLEVRASLVVTALLVGVFAIFHGHAHGTELPPGQSALLYSMGFVIATGCLHALGIGIGAVHRWTWGQKLLRAGGAVVAMGGFFFMWKALA